MTKITKEQYDYALNVLPPHRMEGNAFMIGEPQELFQYDSFDFIDGEYWYIGCLTDAEFHRWVNWRVLV